ncbi:MAG: hypothetical protein GXO78_07375 [Calditrichaeota bacterium]|nr:hypothetical protein [Calditrichota bacterium]
MPQRRSETPSDAASGSGLKILHTADVHIRAFQDDRWQALQVVLTVATQQNVDVVVISGDLFDAAYQGEQVRDRIRELFQTFPGHIVLIPGNHDYQAFLDGYLWGNNVQVILDAREPVVFEGVYFWGIPYETLSEEQITCRLMELDAMARRQAPDAVHVLLYHGELLNARGGPGAYGEETERSYMPVQIEAFKGKIWHYVLSGHFHQSFQCHEFESRKYFVYPGSPISITRKETEARKVNIFSLGEPPGPVVLETPHYQPVEVTLSPEDTWSVFLKRCEDQLKALSNLAIPLLTVGGSFDSHQLGKTERELQDALQEAFPRVQIERIQAVDVHRLYADDLFQTLREKIAQRTDLNPDQREELLALLIKVMTQERV